MSPSHVFGAVRATTIAALCAGAGIALAGCGKTEEGKPSDGAPGAAKAAGEDKSGGDMKCSPGGCPAKDTK